MAKRQLRPTALEGGEDADHDGDEPDQEDGVGTAEVLAGEPVGQVVGVADPERLAFQGTENHDLREVAERDGEDEQRRQDSEWMRILFVIKVRENGHDSEEVADQMTAGIAEERFCLWKIVRKETEQGAAHEEGDGGDEIFAV